MTTEVTATIRNVKSRMLESVPQVAVTVELTNHADRTLVVDSFRIAWIGGDYVEQDAGVVLAAGASASKTVHVVTADALDSPATRVEILATHEASMWERLRR